MRTWGLLPQPAPGPAARRPGLRGMFFGHPWMGGARTVERFETPAQQELCSSCRPAKPARERRRVSHGAAMTWAGRSGIPTFDFHAAASCGLFHASYKRTTRSAASRRRDRC